MCTVSWLHQSGGYQLFVNRDERRTRAKAEPPALSCRDGVRFLAPRDGDFGGAWLATNEFGLSVCLLNGRASGPSPSSRSRGLLVLDLISSVSPAGILERLAGMDLRSFLPFTVAALAPDQPALVVHWDGRRAAPAPDGEACMPLCSSSFDEASAQRSRRAQLARMVRDAGGLHRGVLLAFHRSHAPQPGPDSPCMHRTDAETVSFSWVTVHSSHADFYYESGSPCRSFGGESRTLNLQREESLACLASC